LNDATIWVVYNDKNGTTPTGASTVYTPNGTSKGFTTGFDTLSLAFGVVIGLNTSDSSTTPIAFTRGLLASGAGGTWGDLLGVYGSDGGHMVFLGGNVQYYRNLGSGTASGELISSKGEKASDITTTVKNTRTAVKFIEETPAGTGVTSKPAAGT
jgi:hypothetical protein